MIKKINFVCVLFLNFGLVGALLFKVFMVLMLIILFLFFATNQNLLVSELNGFVFTAFNSIPLPLILNITFFYSLTGVLFIGEDASQKAIIKLTKWTEVL